MAPLEAQSLLRHGRLPARVAQSHQDKVVAKTHRHPDNDIQRMEHPREY